MLEDSLNSRHYEYMDAYIKLVRTIYSEKNFLGIYKIENGEPIKKS